MSATAPAISVVVSTRNRGAMIEPALVSLLAMRHPSFEVIVVDQSSDTLSDGLVRGMAAADSRLHYLRSERTGLSRGRNDGIAASRGEIVAFTDDDCVVDREWLGAIERELNDPGVGGMFGRVLPSEYASRTGIDLAFKASQERVEYVGRCIPWHVGHGANMAFRRDALMAAHGFDELLGAGGLLPSHEDGDMSYRVLARGFRVVFSPRALVYHRQWRDWAERKHVERAYGLGAGGQFIKYVRCGDPYGWRLLATWIWQLGVRRVGAGLLKWRSLRVMHLGLIQLAYPWLGAWRSIRYPVDRQRMVYESGEAPDVLIRGRIGAERRDAALVGAAAKLASEASDPVENR